MLSRSLVLVALTSACGFQHGVPGGGGSNGVIDADVDGMGPVDAMPDAFGFCYGSFKQFCFQTMPTGDYSISGPTTTFDTDVDASCTTVVAQTGGPSLCVVAAANISVTGDVRGTGSRGLVFIATGTFTNTAALEVGSYYLNTTPHAGAGIATGALCGAPTGGVADAVNGGGGGAGGSFAGAGGSGGAGRNNTGGAAGVAAAAVAAPTILRGGCDGTAGGGVGGGVGGRGGGVIYIVAETSFTNEGTIRSSGLGGPGGAAMTGGGGGGSGGMVVLDSPVIMNTGTVSANGGGGGEGGGQNGAGGGGGSGIIATRAAGGSGNINGGNGGSGGAATTLGGDAGAAGDASGGGGGGGGGGAGVVKALRGTLTGNVSPT